MRQNENTAPTASGSKDVVGFAPGSDINGAKGENPSEHDPNWGFANEQFSPGGELRIIKDVPPRAVTYRTEDGQEFFAPADADWQAVFEAGKANGLNPVGILRTIGQFGKFDFQRDKIDNLFYEKYVHASNFGVGVFMRGAGFSLAETKLIGRLYADWESTNPHKEEQSEWWIRGWKAADSGGFPTRSQ